jgi:hypothetical protein
MTFAARERWTPYAVVLVVGVLFAGGAALGADRQPGVWATPPLVLTVVLLGVIALTDRRREERALGSAAADAGLHDAGIQPVPPLTPALARLEPAHVFAGDLGDGVPCRLARVRGLVLCITEAPGGLGVAIAERPPRVLDHDLLPPEIPEGHPLVADPAGLLGADTNADPAVVAWVAAHPLRLAVAADDGTLVVAAPIGRAEDTPFDALRAATRDARARLA